MKEEILLAVAAQVVVAIATSRTSRLWTAKGLRAIADWFDPRA
jgi:hypothetical protein